MKQPTAGSAAPAPVKSEDVWVPSVCDTCRSFCGIKAHRVNGVVVKLEGDPENPANMGKMCAKGQAALMAMYDPNRLATPLRRTNPEKGIGVDPKFVPITWDEALDTITQRLKKVRNDDPRKLLITSFDRAVLKFSRSWATAFGTPNYMWIGYYCGNALHPSTFLTVATHQQEIDLDYCNYCLLIGNQMGFLAGVNPNSLTAKMADARARGMKLVVVDPIGSTAAMKAADWVPIKPGTDAAFVLALINQLVNELKLYDAEFLRKRSNSPYLVRPDGYYARDKASGKPLVWDAKEGRAKPFDAPAQDLALEGEYVADGVRCKTAFQLLKEHVKTYTPEHASQITTVPADTIRRVAKEFGEAASIGATIKIGGVDLPYRPAAAVFFRGSIAHKHGTHHGLATQVLNMIVGNMFVVGGYRALNIVGPGWGPDLGKMEDEPVGAFMTAPVGPWGPGASADGYIIPQGPMSERHPYPQMDPRPPVDLGLHDLYPVATNISPQVQLSILNPRKFALPYNLEMMIICRTNAMMSKADVKLTEETLRRIPFIVAIGSDVDETAEMADIVLPDFHTLERLDPFPQSAMSNMAAAYGYWYWTLRQPVHTPLSGPRHWIEVLTDLAERAGFLREFNHAVNITLKLSGEYRLEPTKKYTIAEIGDRQARCQFGEDKGLTWFSEHGHYKVQRKVAEVYPGSFLQARHPVYFEHLKTLGEKVKAVTDELSIPWDVSDYQPLPEWKPCPDYEVHSPEYDLLASNYKLPFHTFHFTQENPWLTEISDHHAYAYKILINRETARRKGLKDGDLVEVESSVGKTRARLKVSECVHPEVLGIPGTFGSWAKGKPIARGKGPHFNALVPMTPERMDYVSTAVDACVRVKVTKVTP